MRFPSKHMAITLLTSSYLWVTCAIVAKLAAVRWLVLGDANVARALVLEVGFVLLILLPAEALSDRPLRWHLLVDAIVSAALAGVVMYFHYSNRLVTPEAVALLGQAGGVKASVVELFRPTLAFLFADLFLIGALRLWPRSPLSAEPLEWRIVGRVGVLTLALCAGVLAWGFSSDIASSTAAAREQGIIVFEIKHAWEARQMRAQSADVTNRADLLSRIAELEGRPVTTDADSAHFAEIRDKNVVFILAESLQSFPVGLKVEGQSVTPNIDKLMASSYYFPRVIQQVGAGGTSDAEFIANTSLYPLESAPVAEQYADRDIPSMPRLVRSAGYRAITIHANDLTFWNRDQLYPALGYEKAYDKRYFERTEQLAMGTSDVAMLRRAARIIADERTTSGKPVFASIVTLSSHHPYKLPPKYQMLDIPAADEGGVSADYLQAVRYLDHAVGEFVAELERAGLADDTVIVIQGDHFGLQREQMTDEELAWLSAMLGHEYTVTERFTVPLIVHVPGMEGTRVDRTLGQIDTMPTLLNLMGVHTGENVMFGRDALNTQGNLIGVRYYLPTGAFATDKVLVEPKESLSDATVYSLDDGKPTGRATEFRAQHAAVVELERLSDAYIASLPVRAR